MVVRFKEEEKVLGVKGLGVRMDEKRKREDIF